MSANHEISHQFARPSNTRFAAALVMPDLRQSSQCPREFWDVPINHDPSIGEKLEVNIGSKHWKAVRLGVPDRTG